SCGKHAAGQLSCGIATPGLAFDRPEGKRIEASFRKACGGDEKRPARWSVFGGRARDERTWRWPARRLRTCRLDIEPGRAPGEFVTARHLKGEGNSFPARQVHAPGRG